MEKVMVSFLYYSSLSIFVAGAPTSAKIPIDLSNTRLAQGAQSLNPTHNSHIESHTLTVISPQVPATELNEYSVQAKNIAEQIEDLIKQTEQIEDLINQTKYLDVTEEEQFFENLETIEKLTDSLLNVHTKLEVQKAEKQRKETGQTEMVKKDLEFLAQFTEQEVKQFISSLKKEGLDKAKAQAKQEIQDMQDIEEILAIPPPTREEMMSELEEIINAPISEFPDDELMAAL